MIEIKMNIDGFKKKYIKTHYKWPMNNLSTLWNNTNMYIIDSCKKIKCIK